LVAVRQTAFGKVTPGSASRSKAGGKAMHPYDTETRRYMWLAVICGLATLASYVIALAVPLPSLRASYLVFMAFGPLFCVSVFALRMFLRQEHPSIALDVAALLLVIAGAINTLMAAMQGALRIYFSDLPHGESVPAAAHTAWKMGFHSGNSLQLGADMAWDVFVLSGVAILGMALLRHPRFGAWFGWPAILIGVAGLMLNSATFPTPPAEGALFDIGPFVGLWFAATTVRIIILLRQPAA
jgi:hypothetical protein